MPKFITLEPKHLKNEMVVTPDDISEIWAQCRRASATADAIIAVNMAFNLVAKYMEEGLPVHDEGEDDAT